MTDKTVQVMKMFGVDKDRLIQNGVGFKCEIEIECGQVCYITGASGAGKSILFNELFRKFDLTSKINLDDIEVDGEKNLVDCFDGDMLETLTVLSKAGLSDVFTILNCPGNLSEGQRYRFKLAMAIAKGAKTIFADEFCSNLDRITAKAVAYKISKYARKNNVGLVLASSHDDLLGDVDPDIVVIKYLSGKTEIVKKV